MKRILHFTLICIVLVTSGCGLSSDEPASTPKANSSPTPQAQNKIDFAGAQRDVEDAVKRLNSPSTSGQPATVKPVKDHLNRAIQKLGTEETLTDRCTDCTEDKKDEAIKVLRLLNGISKALGKESQKIAELD